MRTTHNFTGLPTKLHLDLSLHATFEKFDDALAFPSDKYYPTKPHNLHTSAVAHMPRRFLNKCGHKTELNTASIQARLGQERQKTFRLLTTAPDVHQ